MSRSRLCWNGLGRVPFERNYSFWNDMHKRAVALMLATVIGTALAHATTCTEAVARCKIAGATKPGIGVSCEAAGAACMKTGRFRGPITNTAWPDNLIRR